MSEIGSDAAVDVNPNDPQAIAASIRSAPAQRAAMRGAGFANAAHFTARQRAAGYLAAYQHVIEVRPTA